MPVPTVITDLNVTAALNSPPGSENVFPALDDYMRASNSFIAQLNANKAPIASPVFTGVVSASLGTALLPSYTFTGDPNNGWWSPAADVQAWSAAGVERLRLDGTALLSTVPVIAPLGAALLPSYSFTADPNTGAWSPGADIYAVSTAGVESLRINGARNVTIAAPTGGTALTTTGFAGQPILALISGAASDATQTLLATGVAQWSARVKTSGGAYVLRSDSAALDVMTFSFNTGVTIHAPASGAALTVAGGAYTITHSQVFTATPTFNASLSNVFEFSGVMTANVTATTITNPSPGQTISIRVKQDATGTRTFAAPAGAKIASAISTAANVASILTLTYSAMDARWEGFWTVLPV